MKYARSLRNRQLAGCLAVLLAVTAAAAAQEPQRSRVTIGDTVITARDIQAQLGGGSARGVGDVEVTSPEMKLWAAEVAVQVGPNRQLLTASASGGVKMEQLTEGPTRVLAEGEAAEYYEQERRANLTGGVTVRYHAPELREPALLTGDRAELNLAEDVITLHRGSEAVHLALHPQGREGAEPPPPVTLEGDRVRLARRETETEIEVTGGPVLTQATSVFRAETLRFLLDPEESEVTQLFAEGNVNFEGRTASGRFILTGDEGRYDRAETLIAMNGNVDLRHTGDDGWTSEASGEELTYNLATETVILRGAPGGGRVQGVIRSPGGPLPRPLGPLPQGERGVVGGGATAGGGGRSADGD